MISGNIIIEFILILCMLSCSIFCVYTDIANAIIRNKVLLFFTIVSIIVNGIYYYVNLNVFFSFLLNMFVLIIFSILFYSMHIWSAGDSKFLIVIMTFIPVRFYINDNYDLNSIITIIIVFSIAFAYLIIESFVLGVKNKDFFRITKKGINIINIIKQYIKCSFFILIIGLLLEYICPEFYTTNYHMFLIINMLIIMMVSRLDKLDNSIIIIIMSIIIIIIYVVFKINFFISIKNILFVLIVMFLSFLCEKYNYKIIKTNEIQEGMILAQATIYNFSLSKIVNLPHKTTEDLRSKLKKDEIIAIRKWEKTKYGMSEILIVRKMPFALFISLGCVLFIIINVYII